MAPSAAPVAAMTVDRGDHYFSDQQPIALLERVNEYVIALTKGSSIKSALSAGPLAGMQITQDMSNGVYRLHGTLGAGPLAVGVAWMSPLFELADSHRWFAPTNEVIVALKPGVSAEDFFRGDARFTSYRPLLGTPDQFLGTVADGAGRSALNLANTLESDPRLQWASPDFYADWERFYTPNDPLYSSQWHLNNTGQFSGTPNADVDAPEAWNITQGGSPNIVIAIVDDGIEYTHPDLAANLWTNPGEIPNNGIDDDGNGWIDDVRGWDFTSNDNDPGPSVSGDMHGTSTSGIAAAVGDNALGVAGIAYKAKFMPTRIFTGGSGTTSSNIASALYYGAGRTANGLGTWQAADISSNSWGGGGSSSAINSALDWARINGRGGKGMPMFFATGNSGTSSVSYPASMASTYSNVIAVGASTNQNVWASYSQYGPQIDFLAPSNGGTFGTVTTDRTSTAGYNTASGAAGNYTNTSASAFGGTSSATPLAAGIAALILSVDPNLTATQVRGLMRGTTDLIAPGSANYSSTTGFSNQYGYGKVNAFTAVSGVGIAKIQMLNGTTPVANNATITFNASVGGSQSFTYRIRNQGSQTLNLGAINLPSGPFSFTNFGSSSLAAGQSTTFSITFAPTVGGTQSRTLTFTTNDASAPTFTLQLNGVAPGGAPTNVTSVVIGDGTAQRSFINQIRVVFDQIITYAGSPTAAYTLQKQSGGSVSLSVSTQTVGNHSEATLTFLSDTFGGSLVDGRYTLTVNGSQVLNNGTPMTGDSTTNFHRFYGDANGDARIDIADFGLFSTTYNLQLGQTGYLSYFDYNGDNRIDIVDFGQLSIRYFTTLP